MVLGGELASNRKWLSSVSGHGPYKHAHVFFPRFMTYLRFVGSSPPFVEHIYPTRWCPGSIAKLVNITPISLWFIGDTSKVNGIINELITGGHHLVTRHGWNQIENPWGEKRF